MLPIPYGRQSITEEDKAAVLNVLDSELLTQGPWVEQFEDSVAKYIGATHAVAVSSGTAALHLAAMALNVQPGQTVLVASNTFVASANCIRYCGGDVEFVDVDAKSYCLDIDELEKKLKSAPPGKYKGIVCVDFAGLPLDLEKLRRVADEYELWILEDACHALGAQFKNSHNEWVYSGNSRYADISVFSFHPVKHIATGEGGLITTSNKKIYEDLCLLRTHGITKNPDKFSKESDGGWYYEMQKLGYNYRISDILCALGTSQLVRIEQNLKRRRDLANTYFNALKDQPLTLPDPNRMQKHAYHLYVVRSSRRQELYTYLREKQIFAQVHYIPVHKQPYYQRLYGDIRLPNAEMYYESALSIPMYHGLTDPDQQRVIEVIKKFHG